MKDIRKYFISDWVKIRKIQSLKIVSSMYIWLFIVPLLAKSFSEVSDIALVTIFEYQFSLVLKLPFSWVIFYLSAVSFVIANLIYQIYCPTLIKDHSDWTSFRESGKSQHHLEEYKSMLNPTLDFIKDEELSDNLDSRTEIDLHLFWRLFEVAKNKHINARIVAVIFANIGFLFIFYVALENFIAVAKIVAENA